MNITCYYNHHSVHLLTTMSRYCFEVDPRFVEISLVKPKNNRKQASLERIPKFLGKPRKVSRENDDETTNNSVEYEEERRSCTIILSTLMKQRTKPSDANVEPRGFAMAIARLDESNDKLYRKNLTCCIN